MAKRRRLELPEQSLTPVLETKSALPPRTRMPIASVAGDTADRAALDEVAGVLAEAEREGRMVRKIPLDRIDSTHLNRDRMVLDPEEMDVLKASIAARGQQTPLEVVQLSGGRFGLISGLRRLRALTDLGQTDALAFVRRPDSAAAAYVAMVEENEIRADLSFYERANIVYQAVGSGVYPDAQAAVKSLFAHVPPARRSKILKFGTLRRSLGKALRFPAAIPEKLGLALAAAIEADAAVAARIVDALRKTPAVDSTAERRVLERALKGPSSPKAAREEIAPGILLDAGKGRAVLSGKAVDAAFLDDLRAWAAKR